MSLSLPPYTSPATSFTFPPLYSFPPFFTKQPNEQTWSHQSQAWISLILAYFKHTKSSRLELSEETLDGELFRNGAIDRKLPLPILRLLVAQMITTGQAEYDPPVARGKQPSAAFIYWKRPQEWAGVIYDWIKEAGLTNSIMTFYELTEGGDLVDQTEFYKLPIPILRKALDVLIKQGKAQVLKGIGEEGDGVKFV